MNKQLKINYIKNIGLLFYFIVLGIERLLAVIFTFSNSKYNFFNDNAFSYYIHILTLVSLVLAFVVINKQFIYMLKAAFTFKEKDLNKLNYKCLSIGAGILLLGGMVHTNFTQLIVQFVAYAGMIVSLMMVIFENYDNKNNRVKLINNFIYILSFAMAIPVSYKITKNNVVFLETYQAIASFVLVVIYTFYMYVFYNKKGESNYLIITLIILLCFDLPIFILRLEETINVFLVVFPSICFINVCIDSIVYIKNKNVIK